MNVSGNTLLQEMQSIAFEAGNTVGNQLPIKESSSAEFSSLLKNALDTVNELQQDSKQKVTAVEMGDRRVSLAEAMIASQKSSVAFEATVQVRNKLVEAYKDIMNMPV
ncbi:flagellar hook-basal body complex protein FliE [Pseudoalteromonas ulvae UL12]|uniref:Flagellar hook-basal body complex protein FliE n=1 Tax=Pseudoalteromonas ulvae TaxID=107327 RepID=A0A244CSH5_PSEDV|nr:flagellar hook-basal body complex protein FliE [Pseudoalteromonas ulvae]MBE0363721.1 flagellar hook-basal body complex protein FliE [Pseudoalteromonas ulvae UL12]OUL58567.1 flagellar hook-basal body complex protein FliE [Pseudoalteromonas ulvae]